MKLGAVLGSLLHYAPCFARRQESVIKRVCDSIAEPCIGLVHQRIIRVEMNEEAISIVKSEFTRPK